MKAALISGAHDLRLAEVPSPVAGPGQVLIRVSHVGICGSDLSYYRHGAVGAFVVTEPLVPGHELAGVIDADPTEFALDGLNHVNLLSRLFARSKHF